MYGLKEAGRLAQNKLIAHPEPAGYIQSPYVPCLFIHKERKTAISLIVDDFLVKYKRPKDAKHLTDTLQQFYVIKIDMQAKKYIGLTIDRDREAGTITLSMPGYMEKLLQRFKHRRITQSKSPGVYTPPNYGAHIQYASTDTSPTLPPEAVKELQEIVWCVLYYARAVDSTFLTSICAVSSDQSAATEQLDAQADRLLSYGASYPNNKKSGMVLENTVRLLLLVPVQSTFCGRWNLIHGQRRRRHRLHQRQHLCFQQNH
jgi:hypothetical protein